MARKRPCRECGKWFQPNARAGMRQRGCDRKACQRCSVAVISFQSAALAIAIGATACV